MSIQAKSTQNSNLDRRDFLKFCSTIAAILGLGPAHAKSVAEALASGNRPPVLWLHFSECTGCSEAFLRATSPWIDEILLDILSLDYHETLMAGAGKTVTDALRAAADKYAGQFICIAEGSVPTADNGIYGMIGGKTMLSIAEEICPKAKTLITFGNCSSFGGIAAAAPNPTGAKGVREAVKGLCTPIIKLPGCAPNPLNLVAILANYLLKGSFPPCDAYGRPEFAYKEIVHEICPWDHGRCSEEIGCKGFKCKNNCTDLKFNEESYPMNVGHPCIACSEPEFWDKMTPFYQEIPRSERNYEYDEKWFIKPCQGTVKPVKNLPKVDQQSRDLFNLKGRKVKTNRNPYRYLVTRPQK